MRKRFLIIALLCIILILSACSWTKDTGAVGDDTKKIKSDLWIEDIEYLKDNLALKHYNVYHTVKKEEYEKEFNDLKKKVPKLEDYEVALKLSQIVASIGDAHTSLYIGLNDVENGYPLNLEWFKDKLKVVAVDKAYQDIIGYNLTAINSIPINEVMNEINTLIPHENEQWLKDMNTAYIQIPKVLKFLKIIKEDKVEFSFEDGKGNVMNLNLTPMTLSKVSFAYAKDLIAEKSVSMQNDDNNGYNNLYWYKYIPEDKIMYFQYNQCTDRYVAKAMGMKDYEQYPVFSEFSDELIKELNEKEINKFVIDLRNNTGGSSNLMSEFAAKLYDIKKLKEEGKIFVITGKKTFSSGVFACITLKNSTKAIFLGEETGGNVNGYGEVVMFTLPNSNIQVSYSTKYFSLSDEYKEGFIPDVKVEQSFEGYLQGIDEAYEAVINYRSE